MRKSKVSVGVVVNDNVGLIHAYLGRKFFPNPEQLMSTVSPVKEMSRSIDLYFVPYIPFFYC
jgi:hypothetical protein